MNDDANIERNIEPVELSPTRAELIERVRARGRQLRARRRVGVAALTTLVIIAVAAPAIAIGTRSTSHSVPPATAVRTVGDFRISLVKRVVPARPGQATAHFGDPCYASPDGKSCLVLGATLVTDRDVRDASVGFDDGQGWVITVAIDRAALRRLAAPVFHEVAIVVGGRVLAAPTVRPGITGTNVDVVPAHATRAEAIRIATAILGHAPAHVDPQPPVLPPTTPPTFSSVKPVPQAWSSKQLTITPSSLGAVQVGMKQHEAEVASGFPFDGSGDGFSYPTTLPAGYPHDFVGLAVGLSGIVVCVGADVGDASPTPRQTVSTPEGVRIGDTVQRLVAVYGTRARFVPAPKSGMTTHAGYVVAEPGGNLAFMLDVAQHRVVGIAGGGRDLGPNTCTG